MCTRAEWFSAPGNYQLKFVARENESGKIGTFEQNLAVPAAQPEKVTLSSVCFRASSCRSKNHPRCRPKAQGVRAKITSSPLEMEGQRIVPSVTQLFHAGADALRFLQAYYPEKADKNATFDPNSLRAGLIFLRNGVQMNATPLLAPAEVDAKTHTASFRISLPLQKLPTGRYTVQVVAIAPARSIRRSAERTWRCNRRRLRLRPVPERVTKDRLAIS